MPQQMAVTVTLRGFEEGRESRVVKAWDNGPIPRVGEVMVAGDEEWKVKAVTYELSERHAEDRMFVVVLADLLGRRGAGRTERR